MPHRHRHRQRRRDLDVGGGLDQRRGPCPADPDPPIQVPPIQVPPIPVPPIPIPPIPVPTVPVPIVTTVLFVPPANYATSVTSSVVQLRRAGSAVTSTPVATFSLGKPAILGIDISVNISPIVDPLASGSYYAVVVMTGPGGSSTSAPSATFAK